MSDPISNISRLASIIMTSASNIETFYKADATKPLVPSLDDTDPHPLDATVHPLEVKHSLQALEGACAQLCATLARPDHTILNDVLKRYLVLLEPACLGVILRSRVADVLLDKPAGMPINEISEYCGVEPKKLSRVLRALCSSHIFREVSNNVFANNRLSMQLVSTNPMWSAGMHTVDEPIGKAAVHLADTLLDPEWGSSYAPEHTAFNRAAGYPRPLYEYLEGKDSEKGAEQGIRFGKAMVGWNRAADAGAIVSRYPWGQLSPGTVVNDLGGDLPERIQQAQGDVWPRECPEAIVEGRIEFKGIDLFTETPIPNCDVYLLKNVIHNLPSDLAHKVLTNTRRAMTPTSRILINEFIIQSPVRVPAGEIKSSQAPDPLLPNFGVGRIRLHYLDISMLTLLNSEERTLEDYVQLVEGSGLHLVKVWDLGESALLELALA
ncbi:hypothetical protein D9756_009106 [Leucocoprinus leucothites]|uniref:O-methyltransferase domain-containing protein n=1 Tax=Leucocoprinus leucothites TaxID=201217 RepID=A0A8H5CZU8_9AGAR|nr:hypothetical protein D9756_009106 [Leucoagaricus leucothites]